MYKLIKIEATYGCNLRCKFCGIQCGEPKKPAFMSMETVERIAENLVEDRMRTGKRRVVSISLRGEPTLNPNLPLIVRTLAPHCKSLFVVSNGTIRDAQYYLDLLKLGATAIHIDIYNREAERLIDDILEVSPEKVVLYDPASGASVWKGVRDKIVALDERESRDKNTRALHNWSGDGAIAQPVRTAPCAESLKYITIRHDGTYALCCNVWKDKVTFGNVRNRTFSEMYYSAEHTVACKTIMVAYGRLQYEPCSACSVKSPFAHMFKKAIGE